MNRSSTDETVVLTSHEFQVLLALTRKPMHGYDITRQCQIDSGGAICAGRGTVYAVLRRLRQRRLVDEDVTVPASGPGRPSRHYKLTGIGHAMLSWEADRMRHAVHLAYERLGKPKKELGSSFFGPGNAGVAGRARD